MAPPAHNLPPPVQVRERLAELRRTGIPFDKAWTMALGTVKWPYDTTHRRQWRLALESAQEEFRAAYEGSESRYGLLARALVAALDREGIDPNEYELIAAA